MASDASKETVSAHDWDPSCSGVVSARLKFAAVVGDPNALWMLAPVVVLLTIAFKTRSILKAVMLGLATGTVTGLSQMEVVKGMFCPMTLFMTLHTAVFAGRGLKFERDAAPEDVSGTVTQPAEQAAPFLDEDKRFGPRLRCGSPFASSVRR